MAKIEEAIQTIVSDALKRGKTETEIRRAFERALDRARHGVKDE